ncbi:hypothetical protein GOB57_24475 [Sinorhizobium meliloti]|nr:hypothetical protein [Sinorhizobium meliloti]
MTGKGCRRYDADVPACQHGGQQAIAREGFQYSSAVEPAREFVAEWTVKIPELAWGMRGHDVPTEDFDFDIHSVNGGIRKPFEVCIWNIRPPNSGS